MDEVDKMLDDQDTEMDQFILQEVLVDNPSTQVICHIQKNEQSNQVLFLFFKLFLILPMKNNKYR